MVKAALILVYITYPSEEEAEKIVQHLLEKKLIVCATIFPVKSTYWWRRKIENSKEIVSFLKTRADKWSQVKAEIKRLHSYEVPCIVKIKGDADRNYLSWIGKSLNK